jgi:hypothetical protein
MVAAGPQLREGQHRRSNEPAREQEPIDFAHAPAAVARAARCEIAALPFALEDGGANVPLQETFVSLSCKSKRSKQ